MSALANIKTVLAAAVADGATLTLAYPSGFTQAKLNGSTGGQIAINQDRWKQGAGGFTVAFGPSDITVTNDSDVSWPKDAEVIASFGDTTQDGSYNPDIRQGPIASLTAATGTASNTVADVGGAFTQATLNNNFKSLADKQNAVIVALRNAGIIVD